ncbi:heme ABC transporter ATP-binding protein [Alkaliphilus peptidifermentans]|uniref:Iron complex transport system ATP-binding protein n=1 Tax=Alkaliphilus peptidifermentans DSM 18978 TaxID=1120976 RepID=A0A1G5K1X3_9FIRM|nr:heme ABC transporter ATP-binding protein [Alkaliphilus peptidifermentans]SCY94672.1 iron complex transport system ATP-binding protein [Alkaliphilus peptidifermentans DSM 18978]
MAKSLIANNLTFKYDESTIIDNISFEIEKKSFVTIIGPNGSGKSTLLKLLAANLEPEKGTIILNDNELNDYSTKSLAKEMAVVPQETNISYDFTVYDIVLMGRNPHIKRFKKESPQDLSIVKEAMEATNTWYLRDRNINEISGGERQRVIIAKAIAQEPKVILLDEPTSSLDIHHQIEVLDLLKTLNKEKGVTIVAVLHDMNLAARYSGEIILMHKGNLITMGKTEAVMTVEILQQAYEMEMVIERNSYTGCLQIHPISLIKRQKELKNVGVHIICGGGTGKGLIQTLVDRGYRVTLGVVNKGDSDWELGCMYNLEMAEEMPFSEISDNSLQVAHKLANSTDVVIMTEVPIGWGNYKNLDILEAQLNQGKRVYQLCSNENIKFDYTGGKGLNKIQLLREKGLIVVEGKDKMLELLEEIK